MNCLEYMSMYNVSDIVRLGAVPGRVIVGCGGGESEMFDTVSWG